MCTLQHLECAGLYWLIHARTQYACWLVHAFIPRGQVCDYSCFPQAVTSVLLIIACLRTRESALVRLFSPVNGIFDEVCTCKYLEAPQGYLFLAQVRAHVSSQAVTPGKLHFWVLTCSLYIVLPYVLYIMNFKKSNSSSVYLYHYSLERTQSRIRQTVMFQ